MKATWIQTSGKTWRVTIDREEPVSQAYLDAAAQMNTTAHRDLMEQARQTTSAFACTAVYWHGP